MAEQKRISYGPTFVISLLITWCLVTPAIAVAFWKTSERSLDTAMPWLSLWVFAVVLPSTTSLRLHRRLNDLVTQAGDPPDRVVRDLTNMRWLLLMFGSMAAMAALSLIVAP